MLAGLLVVLAVLLVGMVVVTGDRSDGNGQPGGAHGRESQPARDGRSPEATTHGRTADPEEFSPGTVRIGKEGTDHDMRFVVNSLSCGRKTIGAPSAELTAKGTFCLADTRLTNVGSAPAALDVTHQRLYDTKGHAYTATAYGKDVLPDSHVFDRIKPGQTTSGTIVFDIPESAAADRLVLHAAPTGKGLTIQL